MILLAIPAVALTIVSIAAFFGRWSWFLDVLANFRVQYAAVLLVMALFLAAGRWFRACLIVLVGALVNAVVIVPLYLGGGETSAAVDDPLRILSFNLLSSNERFGEVVAYIREVDPDIVFLHEASRPWEMAMSGAGLDYEVTRSRSDDLIFGTLVLSRPGDPVTSFGFTVGGPRAVEVNHAGVAVLGIHPVAPTTAERSALRNAQMEFAGEWSDQQAGPHVVVGDFNATPWSYPFRRILRDTELVNSQRGFGIQPTFPAYNPFLIRVPIDHLLHSPDLEVIERRLGPPLGSDHFPVVVELIAPS
ncbi:MAG TPA: endonuclease/exonuclease/phosphatase family protein [Acidimicrobiia bacterium]|nr:endonuclease/exonuclease/phosphatase family protein [Acidimicrobiia bacterium]